MAAPSSDGQQPRQTLPLYGRDRPWDSAEWVTSDDRVRGGASQSYMRTINPERARFCGHLDIKALGGAGFASQRSLGTRHLDLSRYDGVAIDVRHGDGKKYTLILKDQVLPKREDGREQSSVSWEFDFVCKGGGLVEARWDDFKPTYRGRPKCGADPLNLHDIQRVAIMIRSFFGEQEGCFRLDLHAISAARYGSQSPGHAMGRQSDLDSFDDKNCSLNDNSHGQPPPVSWWPVALSWLCP